MITVILQVAFLPFEVLTVIVAVPFLTAFTFPVGSTVATDLSLLDHVNFVEVLEGVRVAFKVRVLPFTSVAEVLLRVTFVGATVFFAVVLALVLAVFAEGVAA